MRGLRCVCWRTANHTGNSRWKVTAFLSKNFVSGSLYVQFILRTVTKFRNTLKNEIETLIVNKLYRTMTHLTSI